MLTLAAATRIFAYLPPADMRKGFRGLSAIVREEFQADPTDGSLFLFINRRRDRMKLLLDENLPRDLRHFLPGHDVFSAGYMGWSGLTNGRLLDKAAAGGFEAILTLDAGFAFQHNPANLPVAVVIIRARSNALGDVQAAVPSLLRCLDSSRRAA